MWLNKSATEIKSSGVAILDTNLIAQPGQWLKVIHNFVFIMSRALNLQYVCISCHSGTMNFNAKPGCQWCSRIGKHSGISGTVVFTKIDNVELRTDGTFREIGYPDHQKVRTPLMEWSAVDMIWDFVVADLLHLLVLGINKRLLNAWQTGVMSCAKWTIYVVNDITNILVQRIGQILPSFWNIVLCCTIGLISKIRSQK